MSYAFAFDASACSGCKACQEACKDKNGLPTGVLWRRVIEVSGGEWRALGSAWENSVFAYNLSLACNHCVHPKCAGVCPVDAYTVRSDGIVLIDPAKCMGCGYCNWACPYRAPQYIAEQGVMTKCNFCFDDLDAGLPPSCVAACPLRVLDVAVTGEAMPAQGYRALWSLLAGEHPFPLPEYSRTEPHLAIKPHPAMSTPLQKYVSNREEIRPRPHPGLPENTPGLATFADLPLVAFTLSAQMAVGMACCLLAFSSIPLPLLLSIGVLLGAGGLISFLHLGKKRNAWRAVIHLKKSWLSREVLLAGLFGISWALAVGLERRPAVSSPVHWLMALLGLGLIGSMAQVYRLRAAPSWNTRRTPVAFFLSAAVLGSLGVNLAAPAAGWAVVAGIALVVEMYLAWAARPAVRGDLAGRLRLALLGLGMSGALLAAIFPQIIGGWLAIPLFLVALAAEVIGRWQFYLGREPLNDRTQI